MASPSRAGRGAVLVLSCSATGREDELVYAGKVGTGLYGRLSRDLHAALVRLERPPALSAAAVAERGRSWVEPELVAEVAFSNWTPDVRLRHPSFLGLRPDKASREVVREECGHGARACADLGRAGPMA